MKENEKKAFDFASNTIKQLIALCTGLIALTITFSKDIIGSIDSADHTSFLFWSWGFYIISVLFGVWAMMALTGSLQPMKSKSGDNEEIENPSKAENEQPEFNINSKNIRIPASLQISSFLIGLLLTIIFGIKSVSSIDKTETTDGIEVIKKVEYELVKPKEVDTLNYEK